MNNHIVIIAYTSIYTNSKKFDNKCDNELKITYTLMLQTTKLI